MSRTASLGGVVSSSDVVLRPSVMLRTYCLVLQPVRTWTRLDFHCLTFFSCCVQVLLGNLSFMLTLLSVTQSILVLLAFFLHIPEAPGPLQWNRADPERLSDFQRCV